MSRWEERDSCRYWALFGPGPDEAVDEGSAVWEAKDPGPVISAQIAGSAKSKLESKNAGGISSRGGSVLLISVGLTSNAPVNAPSPIPLPLDTAPLSATRADKKVSYNGVTA